MGTSRFESTDFGDLLPDPGSYGGAVITARLTRSQRGNRMVEVSFCLLGPPMASFEVRDYFVLEGASSRGLMVARRRLVELYRACGRGPQVGDEIHPQDLVGARLEVQLDHEQRDGQLRVRVRAYRQLLRLGADQEGL